MTSEDDEEAAKAYEQALVYARTKQKRSRDRLGPHNLGDLYMDAHAYERAAAEFTRSLELKRKLGDSSVGWYRVEPRGDCPTATTQNRGVPLVLARPRRRRATWRLGTCGGGSVRPRGACPRRSPSPLALELATRAAGLAEQRNMVRTYVEATDRARPGTTAAGQTRGRPHGVRPGHQRDRTRAPPRGRPFPASRPLPRAASQPVLRRGLSAPGLTATRSPGLRGETKARVLLELLHGDPIESSKGPRLAAGEAAIEFRSHR